MLGLSELGVIGLIGLILLVIFLPIVLTIVLGITFANMLGLAGLSWWAFVIIFYLIIGGILGKVGV